MLISCYVCFTTIKNGSREGWQAQALFGWQSCPCPLPLWKKSCWMTKAGLPGLGAEGPGVGEGAAHLSKSLAQKGVWAGWGRPTTYPRPRTARCVSWMRIQGNCGSPHSVCSEANAFLSYCLCRRLVVGTPITSSLGERPRCLESGRGRPHSSSGERQPGGSIPATLGRGCPGHGHAAQGMPRMESGWLLGMPPRGEGSRALMEGPTGLPSCAGGE